MRCLFSTWMANILAHLTIEWTHETNQNCTSNIVIHRFIFFMLSGSLPTQTIQWANNQLNVVHKLHIHKIHRWPHDCQSPTNWNEIHRMQCETIFNYCQWQFVQINESSNEKMWQEIYFLWCPSGPNQWNYWYIYFSFISHHSYDMCQSNSNFQHQFRSIFPMRKLTSLFLNGTCNNCIEVLSFVRSFVFWLIEMNSFLQKKFAEAVSLIEWTGKKERNLKKFFFFFLFQCQYQSVDFFEKKEIEWQIIKSF